MSTILIKNALRIATMNEANEEIPGGDLFIAGDTIAAVGKSLDVQADTIIDATGKLVLPGFVNTHHHLYQTLFRAIPAVQNAKLFDWLLKLYEIWREITPKAVFLSAQVGLGELLLTGCTTTTDHFYLFPKNQPKTLFDDLVSAATEVGIRFHPTRGSMSCGRSQGGLPPDDVVQTEDEILNDCQRVVERYHDPSPRSMCRVALAPCSPFSVTEDLLRQTVSLARSYHVQCHTHLAETLDEEQYCLQRYGSRPLAYMEKAGWLGSDIWFAHAVYLNDDEIARMGETQTGVAHCPVSNLRLGSGISPVVKMLEHNVPVGLGVDGSASNDSSNMLSELKQALRIHRVTAGVDQMPARRVLSMATRLGAKVLGYDDIGSLEVGKAADVVLFDLRKLGYAGSLHDPLAALLLCGDDDRVDTSIVNGKIVVQGSRLLTIDEEDLYRQSNALASSFVDLAAKKTGIDFLHQS